MRFWCPLFYVFKIIKMGGFWNLDSVVPFALKSGCDAQDCRIFLSLSWSMKKLQLKHSVTKKSLIHGAHEPQRHLKS